MQSYPEDSPAAIIMFPEGTRSRSGQMRRFKTGVAYIAEKLEAPVLPAYVLGTALSLPKLRTVPIRYPVHVAFGEPIEPPNLADSVAGLAGVARDAVPVISSSGNEGAGPSAAVAVATQACDAGNARKQYLREYVDSLYDRWASDLALI